MDYIPGSDKDFDNWIVIFAAFINANFAALGLTPEQNNALQAIFTLWRTDYPAQQSEEAVYKSLTQKKNTTRIDFEKIIRELVGLIQANKNVTNEQKAAMGITVRDETRTPSAVPTTRPIATIDNKDRLQQTVHFYDETTPKSKAKPEGVLGCELKLKVGGAPPTGPSETTYVATDTKTPYIYHFLEADAGKTAHWMLRWVNTRGEFGPWSETISVTISA